MAKIVPITQEPAKVLRKIAREISIRDIVKLRIQRLISDMKETLKNTPSGVGLAAPQVGESLRVFIVSEESEEIDRAEKSGWERRNRKNLTEKNQEPYEKRKWKYYVFINPTSKSVSRRKIEDSEGCLSVHGKFGRVLRHEKIMLEAYDENGKKFTRGSSGFFARVIQHELDHLNGTLFIDKAEELFPVEK